MRSLLITAAVAVFASAPLRPPRWPAGAAGPTSRSTPTYGRSCRRTSTSSTSPTGPVVGGNSLKTGFCLLDLYKLEDNAPTSEKAFWDCYTSYQGISVGWVDQYHQATDGQQVELTGVPNGSDYLLVSTTNPTGVFREQPTTNNTAWVQVTLSADSQGGGDRPLAVLGPRPLRRALGEPLVPIPFGV